GSPRPTGSPLRGPRTPKVPAAPKWTAGAGLIAAARRVSMQGGGSEAEAERAGHAEPEAELVLRAEGGNRRIRRVVDQTVIGGDALDAPAARDRVTRAHLDTDRLQSARGIVFGKARSDRFVLGDAEIGAHVAAGAEVEPRADAERQGVGRTIDRIGANLSEERLMPAEAVAHVGE